MYQQEATGKYKCAKEGNAQFGQEIQFSFSYDVYEVQDEPSEQKRALLNRMSKVDARNTASAKAQSANGHSKVVKQTEAQKAESKKARQLEKAMITALRAKGISNMADLQGLL